MKKIFVILLFATCAVSSNAQFSSASLTAAGLTCAMCSKAIFSALTKLPAVSSVDANLDKSAFNIIFKKDAEVDPDILKKAVEDAGFSVSRLELSGGFNNIKIENDAHVDIGGKYFHFLNVPSTTLNGESTIVMVDKKFLSPKNFRKYSHSTNHPCVETGKAEQCCARAGAMQHGRIYHVTL